MGCILWEALCLDRVWGHYKFSTQVIDKVVSGERPELPQNYEFPLLKPPQGYIALMKSLWAANPAQRPKFKYISECLCSILKNDKTAASTAKLGIQDIDDDVSSKSSSILVDDILMDDEL